MDIVVLPDLKAHLNIPDAVDTYDDALIRFISAATPVVEDLAGHVVPRAIIGEIHDGGCATIVTNHQPVISVDSITEYLGATGYPLTPQAPGAIVDGYGYQLLNPFGLIARWGAYSACSFARGTGNVVINYTVGCAETPENVRLGSLELIRHWWQQSQQGGRPGFNSAAGDDGYTTHDDYAVPYFVAQLLDSSPYAPKRLPGVG